MSNIVIPSTFQQGGLSTKFAGTKLGSELGANIRGGFGIMSYRGKVWATKFQGVETKLMREDGDGARASIEIIIVKAAEPIAKIFYKNGFVDGSNSPPDCWSTNGVTPDGAAPDKQSPTCAGCPQNAFGSKITDAGKQSKACSDSKRLAVVPLNDPKNELMGGPMLLRVPAASLRDLKTYGEQLQAYGYPYFAVATRISFDVQEAYPKFVFSPMRPLTDQEAEIILQMQDSPSVKSILNESVEHVQHDVAPAVPASPFEQKAEAKPAVVNAPQVQAQTPQQNNAANTAMQTAAQQPGVATPEAPAAAPVAKPPRKRRTQAEMLAAAEALRAGKSPAPVSPVATPVQTQPVEPVVEPATSNQEEEAGDDEFDAKLDALLNT